MARLWFPHKIETVNEDTSRCTRREHSTEHLVDILFCLNAELYR